MVLTETTKARLANMQRPLSEQKKIDFLAFILVVLMAFVFDIIGSFAIAVAAEVAIAGDNYADYGFIIFIACVTLLSPFWIWFALRVRRFVGWPRGAFEVSDFVSKSE